MNVEALKGLAAKVEAGEERIWFQKALIYTDHLARDYHGAWAKKAYHGSLDAAKALHDAVLPGWVYGLNFDAHNEKYAFVSDGDFETDEIYSDCHARAWLLAILRALIAEEESK